MGSLRFKELFLSELQIQFISCLGVWLSRVASLSNNSQLPRPATFLDICAMQQLD
jgi:hypothetical protein